MTDTPRTNATPSETPRVDAFAQEALPVLDGETRAEALAKQWSDFARELERDLERWKYRADVLERDLTAARKERDELRALANENAVAAVSVAEERDAAVRDAERLRKALRRLVIEAGEGNEQGRAIDLLSRASINEACTAIATAGEPGEGSPQTGKPPGIEFSRG